MYNKNISILKRKYQLNPMAYGGSYANSLANYADLYNEMERVDSQLVLLKESYSIFNKLVQKNPRRFERDFADVVLELGNVMYVQKSYKESVRYYGEVIPLFREFVKTSPNQYMRKLSSSLIYISSAEIFNNNYSNAESFAREGIEVNPDEEYHYSNLATSLLFQGKYSKAEKIYRKYREEYSNVFLDDLIQYAEAGVIPKKCEADVEKIKKILNETSH
jgi:tetratricopeptide (TPR) repeat protein